MLTRKWRKGTKNDNKKLQTAPSHHRKTKLRKLQRENTSRKNNVYKKEKRCLSIDTSFLFLNIIKQPRKSKM